MVRIVTLVAVLLAAGTCTASPDAIEGEIALTDSPFCDFFAVRTNTGFSLLDWRGGHFVFSEGDTLKGPLTSIGRRAFAFSGSSEMRAEVEEAGVTLARAQWTYYSRCHQKPPDPAALNAVIASQ